MIDDAVSGHVDPGTIRPGVRMRVAASEEWVEGQFTGLRVDGLELVPRSGGAPIRVYFYERGADVEGSKRRAPLPGSARKAAVTVLRSPSCSKTSAICASRKRPL